MTCFHPVRMRAGWGMVFKSQTAMTLLIIDENDQLTNLSNRTGLLCRESGDYRCKDCGSERGIPECAPFPACNLCGKSVDWIRVLP